MKPVRVCFFVSRSGRDHLLMALLDNIDREHHHFDVVVLDEGDGRLGGDLAERGVGLTGLGAMSVRRLPLAVARFRKHLAETRPDVVHANGFYPGLVTELARRTMAAPPASVLARHHNRNHHLQHKHVHVAIDRWTARHATMVMAVSAAVRRTLVEEEGLPGERVYVVHNGPDPSVVQADTADTARWRKEYDGRELLVAAGRIDFQKDYPTIFQAVRHLVPDHPDLVLAIGGSGLAHNEAQARRIVDDLGIADHVEFLGWVDPIYGLMAAADVFVQGSIDEAFGQTVLEAMLLGAPVVSTTGGALAEVVGDLYPPLPTGDPREMASRIHELLVDKPAARARAAEVQAAVAGRFTARGMADGVATAYRRAVGG